MSKPEITLQPTKRTLTQAAAQIYCAYVASGRVPAGEEDDWMKRSIRDAVTIAHSIDVSVLSDNELPELASEPVEVPVPADE